MANHAMGKTITSIISCEGANVNIYIWTKAVFFFSFFLFWLALAVHNFVPTNPRGAQALGKEFPASAPRVIQGAIIIAKANLLLHIR